VARLPEYVQGTLGGVISAFRDVQTALGLRKQMWAQVMDLVNDPNRVLGCISLCSPLYISGTATAFSTGLTGEAVAEGYNYSLTVYQ